MIGFIKKDLLMIKSNLKILLILLFVYGFMAFQGNVDLLFLVPFLSVMIMISTFSYDTYNKWDSYAVTLPDGRKNSVRGKYLATILLIVTVTFIITILSFVISYMRTNDAMIESNLSIMVSYLFATLLLQSIMYPSIYKFGVEKARIGIFIVVFGIAIIGGFLANYTDLTSLTEIFKFVDLYWQIVIPIIVILMLYVSYKISERIYMKKEF